MLAKNPEFLKTLVCEVGKKVDKKFEYKEIEYKYEEAAYELVLEELQKRKNLSK